MPLNGVEQSVRFWSRVSKSSGCWEWTGHKLPAGYGKLRWNDRETYTHRVSWMIHFGAIPDGLFVCHHCDNPRCVRPDHLFLGTNADNQKDRSNKGRHHYGKTTCRRGHAFTPENTRMSGGYRYCIACDHARKSGAPRVNGRMTPDKVLAIRAMLADGKSHRATAEALGVSRESVGGISRGSTWAAV